MESQKADSRNPQMGLDNEICEKPKYWCRLHQVWLSEEDADRKHCKCKPTLDLISTRRCSNLEKKNYDEWKAKLCVVKK